MQKLTRYYFIATFSIMLASSFLLFGTIRNHSVTASDLTDEQSNALFDVNTYRKENGLEELKWNSKLSKAAMLKLLDEEEKGYFDHVSPEGKKAWDFIKITGYEYNFAGENLAIGFKEEHEAFDAWTNSQTHRDNIVSKNYTDFGFASLRANINGVNKVLMVQIFGSQITILDRILSTI